MNKICVLTIAGSDSGAGAGIQSDLKTFRNFGVYGLTVITSVTAQNTIGVQKKFELPVSIIDAQLKSVFADFKFVVVKTGMLSSSKVINAVAKNVKGRKLKIVVDPVILSKNRFSLLDNKGVEALKKKLLPLAYVVTPNIYEAEVLSGHSIKSATDLNIAAKIIKGFGCKCVLIKGGHINNKLGVEPATDVLFDGKKFTFFNSKFIKSQNTHGIGCTLSSAIAANLAFGKSVDESITSAKRYVVKSLKKSLRIGKGTSPLEQ